MKEIWIVSDTNNQYFYSTEAKAYAKCVEIIKEVMIDDKEEMEACLLELKEYNCAVDICHYYMDYIDYDEEEENATESEKIEEKKEDGPRGMKYHIYNRLRDNEPLTADGRVLEFDNKESALRFILSVSDNTDFDLLGAYVVEDILYYDSGYINATNLIINKDGDLEEVE